MQMGHEMRSLAEALPGARLGSSTRGSLEIASASRAKAAALASVFSTPDIFPPEASHTPFPAFRIAPHGTGTFRNLGAGADALRCGAGARRAAVDRALPLPPRERLHPARHLRAHPRAA